MKKIVFLILVSTLIACNKICPTDDLKASRKDNLIRSIRLNGIYYGKTYAGSYSYDNQFFLYKNGIFLTGCSDPSNKIIPNKYECSLSAESINASKCDRSRWGIYSIKNDTIFIERWQSVSDCGHDVFSYVGKILNDSTLLVPQNRQNILLDTFRFAKLSSKPDSMNPYIQ